MTRIVHIITGLSANGAQKMLYNICINSGKLYEHEIISLSDEGDMGRRFAENGIKVLALNLSWRNLPSGIAKAVKVCRKACIVDSWLYHADLFSFIVSRVFLKRCLVWNIRHENLDREYNKRWTLRIARINSFLSRYVDMISYNSRKARESHEKFGYFSRNAVMVKNGFDLEKFRFNENGRKRIREELDIRDEDIAIVTAGRWNVLKGYSVLFDSLRILKSRGYDYSLIMAGKGLDGTNFEIKRLLYGIEDRVILLGKRDDIPDIFSAGDIFVSPSISESFSNSIGEAMACSLACVVTDAGESAEITGDTGMVAGAGDIDALAEGLIGMIKADPRGYGEKARKRAEEYYDIRKVVKEYENIYAKACRK